MKKQNIHDKISWVICIITCIIIDKIAMEHNVSTFITMVVLEIICVFVIMVNDNL